MRVLVGGSLIWEYVTMTMQELSDAFLEYGRLCWTLVGLIWIGVCSYYEDSSSVAAPVISATVFFWLLMSVAFKMGWYNNATTNKSRLQQDMHGLGTVHMSAAFLHSTSSLLLAILAGSKTWQSKMTVTITEWRPFNTTLNVTCGDSACFIAQRIAVLTDVSLPVLDLVILAALVSASYHIAIYNSDAEKRKILEGTSALGSIRKTSPRAATVPTSRARWHDYSISASAILVVVANLSGITDVFDLVLLGTLQWILLDMAGRLEHRFQNKEAGSMWEFGALLWAYLLMWIPILYAFFSGWIYDPRPPDGIITIIIVLFVLYGAFVDVFFASRDGAVCGMKLTRRQIEIAYAALSFVSKTSLHWLLYVGIEGREGRVANTAEEGAKNYKTGRDSSDADILTIGLVAAGALALGILFAIVSLRMWKKDDAPATKGSDLKLNLLNNNSNTTANDSSFM